MGHSLLCGFSKGDVWALALCVCMISGRVCGHWHSVASARRMCGHWHSVWFSTSKSITTWEMDYHQMSVLYGCSGRVAVLLEGSTNTKGLSSKGVKSCRAKGSLDVTARDFQTNRKSTWDQLMVSLGGILQRYGSRWLRSRSRPIVESDTIENQSWWQMKHHVCPESKRLSSNGAASLPCSLTVLCGEPGAVLPAIPEVRRSGPGCVPQYCLWLLTDIMDLQPGDIVYPLEEAHFYLNHIKPLKIQHQQELRLSLSSKSFEELRQLIRSELKSFRPKGTIQSLIKIEMAFYFNINSLQGLSQIPKVKQRVFFAKEKIN